MKSSSPKTSRKKISHPSRRAQTIAAASATVTADAAAITERTEHSAPASKMQHVHVSGSIAGTLGAGAGVISSAALAGGVGASSHGATGKGELGATGADIAIVRVIAQSPQGDGIALYEGKELYIPQMLVGELLEVKVGEPFARGSKRCAAKLVRLIEPSPMRQDPSSYECAYFERCGGCQLMHMRYEEQLRLKREDIAAALQVVEHSVGRDLNLSSRLRPVVPCNTRPCRFKSLRYFARGKSAIEDTSCAAASSSDAAASSSSAYSLELGFYAPRSHKLVSVEACPLEPKRLGELSSSLLQCCRALKLEAYDESVSSGNGALGAGAAVSKEGRLRAILWRMGDQGEVLGSLIVSGALRDANKAALTVWAQQEQVTSFTLGYNSKAGNALFTADTELLYGQECIKKTLLGLSFEVYAPTFLQVNYEICEKLYKAAIAHCAGIEHPEESKPILSTASAQTDAASAFASMATINTSNALITSNGTASTAADAAIPSSSSSSVVGLDLCCGVGTMTLALSSYFAQVIGVEIVPEAIAAAERNAALNGITNARFVASDLKQVLPRLLKEQRKQGMHIGGIIADPARVGLGPDNVKALALVPGPCKLSLIFCALPALKRDLPELLRHGFELDYVQGFDLFPHSSHVETVVLLSKLNTKQHIEVELNLDELDLTSAESKATYEEIKAYVLEHTGLKVSHLYIAQVKQKYGIIERENYNKPKSENAKQPKCPPEKEAAITEALKFFGMI